MKPILAAMCGALLVGCAATPEQLAQRQVEQEAELEAMARALITRCERFGYKQGTDAFAGCIERFITTAERCQKERSAAQAVYYQELSRRSAQPGSTFIGAANDAGSVALRRLSPECQQ